ncbi:MAG: glycoside hydrolase family 5 protein [Lachnospira sp.]
MKDYNRKRLNRMKNHNRIKSIMCLICVTIIFSICGCGMSEKDNKETDATGSSQITSSKVADDKETQKETTTDSPISPTDYQKMLGKGVDVDWCKTDQGMVYYNRKAAQDFKDAGVNHVRIRIKDEAEDKLLSHLDRIIDDCLDVGLIPVVAYQADEFKNDPSQSNIDKVVKWWGTVASRYKDKPYTVSFDIMIESSDAVNKQQEQLNSMYDQVVTEIRKTNPSRIIFISPRLRSDPAYLGELVIPQQHNGYLMAEWHFYAAGPDKKNEKKKWTTGTDAEKQLILDKINIALKWQEDTGIPTWVGAWMPGNYNDGDDYSVDEQVVFAGFMRKALESSGIPFAVNSDTKFYDRESNTWIESMQPVFNSIFR